MVICDRQQGAVEKVAKRGIQVQSLITITEIMNYLLEDDYVTKESCDLVRDYLAKSQVADVFNEKCNGI